VLIQICEWRWEMIVRFVGICGLADDHCLLVFFFIKKKYIIQHTLWFVDSISCRGVFYTALGYNICQWFLECRFCFSIIPISSTKTTDPQVVKTVYTSLVQTQSSPFRIHDVKRKRTDHILHYTTQKTKDWAAWTHFKVGWTHVLRNGKQSLAGHVAVIELF
jgi:hypothetical protein